jgi:hypothetical protein
MVDGLFHRCRALMGTLLKAFLKDFVKKIFALFGSKVDQSL